MGEEGIGKKLTALTLAKALNCLQDNLDSCDRCLSCRKIDNGQHPDVHIIEGQATEAIKIEYIRQLQKEINLKAYEARKKVFIINDAHNFTAEAANAMLKVLEEPPENSLIILISSKPASLFKTILSRCKIIKFHPLKREELAGILKSGYQIDGAGAHFLAYFSEGRLGLALRLKDTEIFSKKNRIIDELIFAKGAVIDAKDRADLRNALNILATWFRDIYFVKIGMPQDELINLDRQEALLGSMHRFSLYELDDIMKSISDSLLYLEQNINTRLLLSNLKGQIWKRQS